MRKKLVAAVVAMALGAFAFAAPAGAAGGNGASYCSGASGPDGIVDPGDVTTWNSPGEIISFVAPEQEKPGQLVKALCNPTQQVNGEN
jgi:hypothetical protein